MVMHKAIDVVATKLEEMGIGKRQVNYKMRDAGWSRQRYWGEPFPVVFKDGMPYAMKESELPLELPPSDNFKPSGNGEGPLANLTDWINFAPDQNATATPCLRMPVLRGIFYATWIHTTNTLSRIRKRSTTGTR
jgi:leucyl-tRNA synthetase